MPKYKTRFKGRFISEKQLSRKEKQVAVGRSKRKEENRGDLRPNCLVEGLRIVDFRVLASHMYCTFCKSILSLEDITSEIRKGLASVFKVKCQDCLTINDVPTGYTHTTTTGEKLFDINSKIVIATLHTGNGFTTMSKFFAILNIPCMTINTFKYHEREIGPVLEIVAKESCKEVAERERALLIENKENLEQFLPEDMRNNFLIVLDTKSLNESAAKKDVQNSFECKSESDVRDCQVRLLGAFDMGWSKRGNGKQYDSLNGYLSMIGPLSGGVMDYTTRNRKCRKCDLGYSKNSHDCRLNFCGSAKAMEADAAADLATNSSVLKGVKAEIGIFIGDNDSSSISAVRNASDHVVLKHSDKNHTSKGVKNMLYKIDKKKDVDNEINSESITYLHRCFTYAMAQNKGDLNGMTAAVRNIPYHAYDKHDNCGSWCGFIKDPENYEHKTVPEGFKTPILFEELKTIFCNLADNADTYFAGASSQANESLNAIMARKSPKAICYSLSESADYRYSCAVSQKNLKESYVEKTIKVLQLSPGKHLNKHVTKTVKAAESKALKAKTVLFKSRRRTLQKYRTQLKNRKQKVEGTTYESHMGLVNNIIISREKNQPQNSKITENQVSSGNMFVNEETEIIFFDLETSGLSNNCDILQIAMKCGNFVFNKYIYPKRPIPTKVTEVNGLSNVDGQLYLNGKHVVSSPLRLVVGQLLQFLKQFDKKCTLIAHNCAFDAPRLIRIIHECNLQSDFENVISHFVDTLPLFRNKFPTKKEKGALKLTTLASELLSLPIDKAHDANYDIFLLEQLVFQNFNYETLLKGHKSFKTYLEAPVLKKKAKEAYESLNPLQDVVSTSIRKRLSEAGVDYEQLLNANKIGEMQLVEILKQPYRQMKHLITTKKIINKFIEHFKNANF